MNLESKKKKQLSGFLSKLLRHAANEFNLILDKEGYCTIDELLSVIQSQSRWQEAKRDDIVSIAQSCEKQRFKISGDKIKANYGHSMPVTIEKVERELPNILFHGTNQKALESILGRREGLKSMNRQYVHLSETTDFALLAAKRRENPLLLKVDVKKALSLNVEFKYVENEVWLATAIPYDAIIRD